MNALHSGNTSLVRVRPTRSSTSSLKPLQTTGPTTSLASSQPSPSPFSFSLATPSSISLFLTSLRLLDLDLHPDWPGITAQTFSAKDAQKKRIQSVEWALYHLFSLWDPAEARSKLQPFFPPLDQVQSLNLRAALLRSLEQAKKNGVLGRDAVVRKTMLDECRGERLEEVLAALAAAVLRKLAAQQLLDEPVHPAAALTLALENHGYAADRTELNVLVLAHKASLSRLVHNKKTARAQFSSLAALLDAKEQQLERRHARIASTPESPVADDVRLGVRRTVRNNWTGSERWMEALLGGDAHAKKDGVLSAPFDRVWRRAQSGRLAELQDAGGGLVEQLDRRVSVQRERLQRWRQFRSDVLGQDGHRPRFRERGQRGVDLGFGVHETFRLDHPGSKPTPAKPLALTREYSDLVSALHDELAAINRGSSAPAGLPKTRRMDRAPAQEAVQEPISEMSDLEDDALAPIPDYNNRPVRPASLTREGDWGLPPRPEKPSSHRHEKPSSHRPSTPELPLQLPKAPVARRTPSPKKDSTPQLMADQILASIEAGTPSPVKKHRHTLSLAERTRLSMVRRGSQASALADDDEADLELDAFRQRSPPKVHVDAPKMVDSDDESAGYENLVARTRRSMAGQEAARQKAQLERRRSQRKSRQLAVPAGRQESFSALEEEGNSTLLLAEELMNKPDEDYEAVFRSRPKIKTSPVGTPVRGTSAQPGV